MAKDSDAPQLDHGVLLTGYGEENGVKYWNIKNSWGAEWGDGHGFIKLERGDAVPAEGSCGVLMQPSYPCVKGGPQPHEGCATEPSDDDDDNVPTDDTSYEKPNNGQCNKDEIAVRLGKPDGTPIPGSFCAPKCSGANGDTCPPAPAGAAARPMCAVQDPKGDKYCALLCQKTSHCPNGADCQPIQPGVGLCTYKDDNAMNAMSVEFVRDVVNAKKTVDSNDDVFETETIFQ